MTTQPAIRISASVYSLVSSPLDTNAAEITAYLYEHTVLAGNGIAKADRRRFWILRTTVDFIDDGTCSERNARGEVEYLANYQNGRMQSGNFGASITGSMEQTITAATQMCPTTIEWTWTHDAAHNAQKGN
jgi:hypothetical protein